MSDKTYPLLFGYICRWWKLSWHDQSLYHRFSINALIHEWIIDLSMSENWFFPPLWKRWVTITFSFWFFLFSFILLFQVYLWYWFKQIFKILIVLIALNRKNILECHSNMKIWQQQVLSSHEDMNSFRCMLALAIDKILFLFTQQIFIFVYITIQSSGECLAFSKGRGKCFLFLTYLSCYKLLARWLLRFGWNWKS